MTIRLTALHIYPVKSLGGIGLQQAALTPRGLAHDRRFLVVDADGEFLTQREYSQMATVWVDIDSDTLTLAAPDLDAVEMPLAPPKQPTRKVRVWNSVVDAHSVSTEADRFLSDYLGMACHLVYMPDDSERAVNPEFGRPGDIVSFADGYPFLLASESSLAELNRRIQASGGQPVPMNRFRPNLVISGAPTDAEDTWKEIRVGEAVFRVAKPCTRCQVTTTDQASGEVRGPEPLATLATYRDSQKGVVFGQNLIPTKLANIRVGDEVTILR
jgi:uncharacterized protein